MRRGVLGPARHACCWLLSARAGVAGRRGGEDEPCTGARQTNLFDLFVCRRYLSIAPCRSLFSTLTAVSTTVLPEVNTALLPETASL